MTEQTMQQANEEQKKEQKSLIWNLLFNVVIPSLILTKLSKPEYLGQLYALIIALIFPFCYGAMDLIKSKKWNFISILGLVSILLTGGLTLLKLEGIWFAVKEAFIPGAIGIAVLLLYKTQYSVLKLLLFNPKIFKTELIHQRLAEKQTEQSFEKMLFTANLLFASSFILSAILNFSLAVILLKSPTGTVEFNEELGRMAALSFPVIMLPCMVVTLITLLFLFKGIKKYAGLGFEEIIHDSSKK